jgi:hypothetical protein
MGHQIQSSKKSSDQASLSHLNAQDTCYWVHHKQYFCNEVPLHLAENVQLYLPPTPEM